MTQQSNTALFWALVIGLFSIIFLLWFPNFVGSVKTLRQSIQEGSKQTADLRQEWTAKSAEIKNTFDSFLQQQTSLLNTAGIAPNNQNNTITNESLK